MPDLQIHLFGRFSVRSAAGTVIPGLDAARVQELFSFLLLSRHTCPRESLADQLWGATSGLQARKALRQTLWQLQSALEHCLESTERIILVDPEWVSMNPAARVWLDVDEFERAQRACQGVAGHDLSNEQAGKLQQAIELYGDGLLPGCYREWCLCERERLEQVYVALLDKLMRYAEAHQNYDGGLDYGERILRRDRARERTHRRMMRLYVLAGDRTGALRQYERCVSALREELDVAPALETRRLYDDVRLDGLESVAPAFTAPVQIVEPVRTLLAHLQEVGQGLAQVQQLVRQQQQRLELLEQRLRGR
jgi:DNA-binding SARP family transcriptional activator